MSGKTTAQASISSLKESKRSNIKLPTTEKLQSAEYLAFKYLIEQVDQLKAEISEIKAKLNK